MFPAGPPAAILLYTLAPELLLGWPRANRPEECEFLLPEICARPEVGRLTGRGNTANLEVVLALKPDLILDVGSTNPTYVSLAERVQEQTGIPYALLDGRFDATAVDLPQARRADAPAEPSRGAGALRRRDDDDDQGRIADIPAEPAAARLLRARAARARDRARRLDQRGDDRIPRRRNVAGERQGGLATVSVEQVLLWNPTSSSRSTATSRRTSAAIRSGRRSPAVRAGRVHLSPKLPFGWVDFPPSVNRLIGLWWLAKILYPEHFPEDLARADPRFLHAVLSRDADRRADRRVSWRGGIDTLPRCPAPPPPVC